MRSKLKELSGFSTMIFITFMRNIENNKKYSFAQNSEKKHVNSEEDRLIAYFETTRNKTQIDPLFKNAIDTAKKRNSDQEMLLALDWGTGTGSVAIAAARAGFRVIAADKHPKALKITADRAIELDLPIAVQKINIGE